MYRCLQLAQLGCGHVAPNPMVGAVLVFNNRIIGEGYHAQCGKAHAEVNCINSVAEIDKILIENGCIHIQFQLIEKLNQNFVGFAKLVNGKWIVKKA